MNLLTDTRVAAIKPPAEGREEHPDAKVTGLRLRVGAGGQKTWIVRKRVGAKTINKKLGTYPALSLAKAREGALAVIEALERDGSTDALARTFGAVADTWVDKVAKVKNGSWQLQKRRLEMHVYPTWKDRKIIDIKRSDVRELLEGIKGDVLPNRVQTLIKTIFRYALSRDWIEASPVEGITKLRDESPRERVLDMGEVKRIWDAADLLGFPFGHYIRVLLLTAQRRTEVAGMKWADVDLEAGTWVLSSAETKSDRAHLVPLSPAVVDILSALPRLGPFVFTTDGKTHMKSYSKAKARLDEFLTAKGDPLAPWRLHDLRRTAATHMVRLGVLEEVVGRVLNHARTGVTAKVYALHSYAPEKRSALDRWAAEVLRAVGEKAASNVVALHGD
jgi:integrase